jgi:hypothetical protein
MIGDFVRAGTSGAGARRPLPDRGRGRSTSSDGGRFGARLLAALWLVVLGLLVGGAAIPHADDAPSLREDYEACISTARGELPSQGDPYEELVSAMHACGVMDAGAQG